MRRLRFAIIGCGQNASKHGDSVLHIPYLDLIAVCDKNKDKAEVFANTYKAEKVYTDYRELLEKEKLDLVAVSTPHVLHTEIARESLEHSVNVLVEKPLALSSEEAKDLCLLADKLGLRLGMVAQMRYNPLIEIAQEAVNSAFLGRLFLGNVRMLWHRPQEYFENSWRGTKLYDGGMVFNMAIHYIDILLSFFGRVKSIQAVSDTFTHKIETEDTAIAIMRFENGALATFEGSFSIYPHNIETSVSIFGESGSIVIGGVALNSINVWDIKDNRIIPEILLYEPKSLGKICFRRMMADFCEGLLENRPTRIDGLKAIPTLETVEMFYNSMEKEKKCQEQLV
ncbi:MAG: Gfo/Idh/MocA family protein [bacterium]